LLAQILAAPVLELHVLQAGLGLVQRRPGLLLLGLVIAIAYAQDDLALFDKIVDVEIDAFDLTRDFGRKRRLLARLDNAIDTVFSAAASRQAGSGVFATGAYPTPTRG
jgi:hypothetical protein